MQESRDPQRARSIDYAGTVLIAVALVPLVLGFSKGGDWGWTSAATLGCFVASAVGAVLFVVVEKRVSAPIVDLDLLRNQVLVGATLAILIVAGTLNGLMYVLSLYFQDPATFGMSPLETGVATLPAAAGLIAVTPLITPLAARIGTRLAIVAGFGLRRCRVRGVGVRRVVLDVRGPRPPARGARGRARPGERAGVVGVDSTAVVPQDQVGQASGISNMARYIGGSVVVALVATIFNSVTVEETAAGASASEALASGLSRAALLMAILSGLGIALALLMARHQQARPSAVDLAAAAAGPPRTRSRHDPCTSRARGSDGRQEANGVPALSAPSAPPDGIGGSSRSPHRRFRRGLRLRRRGGRKMCRWLAYSGSPIKLEELLLKRDRSLIDQSLHSRLGATTTNGDGFGVGWYDDSGTPRLYRSVHPAWNDRNLRELAAGVSSPLFLAHIRASTGTAIQETNAHPFRYGRWLWMHNGLIREFPRFRRELVLAVDESLFTSIEGTTDSETMFYLALTFGLESDPVGAVEKMVGFVEETGRRHGVENPLQMTIGTSDGQSIYAFRYSSEGASRSLYFSTRMDALKALHPDIEELAGLSDETRVVLSEPLGDLEGAWNEVPESHVGIIQPGDDELRPFTPR